MSGNAPPRGWEWPIILVLLLWDCIKSKAVSLWRRLTGRGRNG